MKKFLFPLAAICFLAACSKKDTQSQDINGTLSGNIAPIGFDFKTTKPIVVDIALQTNDDRPISYIPVSVFGYYNGKLTEKLTTAVTDLSGVASTNVSVPSYLDSFVVRPNFIGVMNNAVVYLTNGKLSCTLGGSKGFKGNVAGTYNTNNAKLRNTITMNGIGASGQNGLFGINGTTTSTDFSYLGTVNVLGRPSYLEKTDDVITGDMLKSITYSVPEGQNLANSVKGNSYLSSNATSNIVLQSKSDVFVTFVYEDAGYRNALGYYKYATKNPPSTLADIKNVTFVFPNSSLTNSGGDLSSGNKVKIGTVGADTTIGFVLFSDGWSSSKAPYVNTNATAFFTDSYLNPEKKSSLQKHTVLMKYVDPSTSKEFFVVGFEDLNRENGGSDQDFNDCIYYVTTSTVDAVDDSGIKPVSQPVDSDKDGVDDALDAYPNDASRAYDNYYPSVGNWGTLSFEDNWPAQGDYDLNDLVVNYRYKLVLNAKNQLVEMNADFVPLASGANYDNGLGIQLPFAASLVSSITGQKLNNGYINTNANGTEASQSKAVVFPFDGVKSLLNYPNGNSFVNTVMSNDKAKGDTVNLVIKLTSASITVDPAAFNPFLVSNKRRAYEVHLPGFLPTDLADRSLLGTNADASNLSTGVTYVTTKNYPFALNFAEGFSYPTELSAINDAYLRFFDWSGSGGKTYTDWYKNTGAGYRNAALIYSK